MRENTKININKTKPLFITIFVLVLMVSFSVSAYAGIKKGPYVQKVFKDSTTIVWETSNSTSGTVEWGTTSDLGQTLTSEPGTMHEVEIEGLSKNSSYYYRVKSDGDESQIYKFKTAPDAYTPFRLVAYGDSRSGYDVHTRAISALLMEEPDIYMNSGDLVGTGTDETAWQKHFEIEQDLSSVVPMLPAIGNHDTDGLDCKLYKKYFALPSNGTENDSEELYYYQDWGNTRIISIECEISTMTMGSTQYNWLIDRLEEAKDDPYIQHVILMTHKGPYTAVPGRSGNMLMRAILDTLKSYNVQVIISGHDHHYYRGKAANQLDFIVTGGGGAGLYDCEPTNQDGITNLAWSKDNNYVVFDIDKEDITATAKTLDGQIIDTFEWKSSKTLPDEIPVDGDTDGDVDETVVDGDEVVEDGDVNIAEEVSETVSASDGADLSLSDSSLTLSIPANALTDDTTITITPEAKLGYPEASRLASYVYSFTPTDVAFSKNATLSVEIQSSIPEGYEPILVSLQNTEWVEVDGSYESDGFMFAEINQLATFAVYISGDGATTDGDVIADGDSDTSGGSSAVEPSVGFAGCQNVNSVSGLFLLLSALMGIFIARRRIVNNSK